MIILGIDPGFGRLGYAVIKSEKNDIQVIECSCLETSPKQKHEKRLILIADKVKELLAKYRPQTLALEKVFFAKNQKTALQVAEIRGILLYLAASSDTPVCEYTPLEVKMAICGYGKAAKDQVEKMIKMLLKLQSLPKSDDAVDALAISLTCAVCLPAGQAGLPASQKFE